MPDTTGHSTAASHPGLDGWVCGCTMLCCWKVDDSRFPHGQALRIFPSPCVSSALSFEACCRQQQRRRTPNHPNLDDCSLFDYFCCLFDRCCCLFDVVTCPTTAVACLTTACRTVPCFKLVAAVGGSRPQQWPNRQRLWSNRRQLWSNRPPQRPNKPRRVSNRPTPSRSR